MSGRAHPSVRKFYERHLRECHDCRRVHRVLHAIYEGPPVPPAPHGVGEEREFHAILRKSRGDAPEPWYQRFSIRLGVVALSATAAVLTLSLLDLDPASFAERAFGGVTDFSVALGDTPDGDVELEDDGFEDPAESGGIDHPAQGYGRIVAGSPDAIVGAGLTNRTFKVGTKFKVALAQSLQVGLVGKIVANITAGSEIEWTTATPNMLEVELTRGILAMRYDRRPSDPILQVRTPTALVRVVGTVFTVQVDAEQDTVVSVLRGEVQVLNPSSNQLLTEVEAGYRFDVSNSSVGDVGRVEVAAALPLSNEVPASSADPSDAVQLADGGIPPSWTVPGLPADPDYRTLAFVPASEPNAAFDTSDLITLDRRRPPAAQPAPVIEIDDDFDGFDDEADESDQPVDGKALIEQLERDAKATHKRELRRTLAKCRRLYAKSETRYLSARCYSTFLAKYGEDPLAVEGYLAVGILRMDYALDYRAAEVAFKEFLVRAPGHPKAERALYRLLLSSTEDGRISEALEWGRKYLQRHPDGHYVGKILQRFPELKSAL